MDNMSNAEIAEIFREHVTHKETGRIISKRFNIPYLEKNKKDLLDQIMKRTLFLDDSFSIRERLFFLSKNITTPQYCIVCGGIVHPKFYDGWDKASLNDVCSKECWNKHPRKSEILKEGCKNRDEETAKVKRAATMKEKFGVEYTLQREDQRQKLSDRYKTNENANSLEKLRDYEWVKEEYINKKRFLIDIADELKCHYSTVSDWVERHGFEIRQTMGYSQLEVEIRNYLDSLGVEYLQNSKKILGDKKELDIFIPSKNIAIELDGIFWHSFSYNESKEERELHLTKTKEAEKLGIQLLHFWCVEWEQKPQIVKSIIKSKLGVNDKIYARKCEVTEVSSKEADNFLNNNNRNFHRNWFCTR
jgi:G:T-mismatch repair DNA endonuclease (very short patch repair protein)